MSADAFLRRVRKAEERGHASLIALFTYYLTVEVGQEHATVADVRRCYQECDLTPSTRLASYFSEGLSSKPQRYVKVGNGYKLQRHFRDGLAKEFGDPAVVQTSAVLRGLEQEFAEGPKRAFLHETIACFEAGACRASVVMCWILCVDHLFDHVLNHRLSDFNAALSKNPDKRVKIVVTKNDLHDLSESKFIELLRAANIISNDVRKILDQKLGIRNSSAHPSSVTIGTTKVVDFVEDLIRNVVLQFSE